MKTSIVSACITLFTIGVVFVSPLQKASPREYHYVSDGKIPTECLGQGSRFS
jgi:hypothetical protein